LASGIVVFALLPATIFAQQQLRERQVKDLWAEQTSDFVAASSLCQSVKLSGHSVQKVRDVKPESVEKSLDDLMRKSDEVVLVSWPNRSLDAVSPSGLDVIGYNDVIVLRSWKGSHRAGDSLTFAIPHGTLQCPGISPPDHAAFTTMVGGFKWKPLWGAQVLFLRHSNSDEAKLLPGLRPTAGDGLQGVFDIPFSLPATDQACYAVSPGTLETCNLLLETSQTPILVPYRLDPLVTKYDRMPVSDFLREVRSVAKSQAYQETNSILE